MKPSGYSININGVDSTIEEHYRQESIKLKENLIEEYRAVGGDLPGK